MADSEFGSLMVLVPGAHADAQFPVQVHDLKSRVAANGFSGTSIPIPAGRYFITATSADGERLQVDDLVSIEPNGNLQVELSLAGSDLAAALSNAPVDTMQGTAVPIAQSLAEDDEVLHSDAPQLVRQQFAGNNVSVWALEGDWLSYWMSDQAGTFPSPGLPVLRSIVIPQIQPSVVVIEAAREKARDQLVNVTLGKRTITIALPCDLSGTTRLKLDLSGNDVAVAEVVFPQRSLNRFYKYVATGHTLEARSISRQILAQAETLMWENLESPLSAVVAAYVLLRANDSDPKQRARMDRWTAKLQQHAPWIPDASAIRIEFLARTGRDEEAISLLLSLEHLGCPWFRSGLSYLVERLRMYASMHASRVRNPKAVSIDDARHLAKLLEALSPLALKADGRQTLCVYRDVYRDYHRSPATQSDSLTLVGDAPMPTPLVRKFRGLVAVRDGRATLSSGGLAAELRRADGAPAVDLVDAIKGTIASISGVQRGDVIEVDDNFASDATEMAHAGDMQDVLATLEAQYSRLKDAPGVLAVRPGYRRRAGMQSVEPSIVVVVDRKRDASELTSREMLPPRLGAVCVDVVEPAPQERLTGHYVDFDDWRRALGLAPTTVDDSPTIGYQPPPGATLQAVTVQQVLCHVGPDAGWKVLDGFLDATKKQLNVSMYDLTAPHVVERLSALAAKTDVRLNMILQVDKAQERQSMLGLHEQWGERLGFVPAVVSGAGRLFKNSYHTKVAVRDGNCLWLSSGNWTSMSQPVISPGPQPFLYRLGNREWHVVVQDPALAKMFETFVLWDQDEARRVGISGPPDQTPPDVLVSDADYLDADAMIAQPGVFEPAMLPVAGGPVRVQPLMTPDNYPEAILNLIESAAETLYLQFSYIRLPAGVDGYHLLLQAVNRKMREGVDVRVIVDRRNQRDADLQFLRSLGWDMERVRLQRSSVHNKGILVDGSIAVVGSHNWSSDGVQWNRDASLVLHHREIAQYFAQVFLFDWSLLTLPVSAGAVPAEIAELGQPTPPGKVRLPWQAWFDA